MSNYAKADSSTQSFASKYPGSKLTLTRDTMVAVLHTTEGMTWPDYDGGSMAPNYTGLPPIGSSRGKWRAHFPDEMSSRALKNLSGGVETNTANAVQFELIGTCDPRHMKSWNGEGRLFAGKDYVYWPKATARQKAWLAGILADMHKRHGLVLHAPKVFVPYPASYGIDNGVRLSFDEWHKVRGVIGHQHVPENTHGDPGNIDTDYVLKKARKIVRSKFKMVGKR